ncbi:MAG: ComF family protein [Bdellovibrionales bacterium]|nr:ComF family protein [Bdellovibrionales bacterium]
MNLSLKSLRSKIATYRWLACPICNAIHFRRAFCADCANHLWQRREPIVRLTNHFPIRSLFSWHKDDWPGLRWWIMALKHKEDFAYWKEAAVWMLQTYPFPDRRAVLVPIPSLAGENHALGLARALSHYTGWPIDQRLKLTEQKAQKDLSRKERTLRFFERDIDRGLDQLCSKYMDTLIIDDVVTTGATAKAAYQALQRPRNTQVWCLLDRRPCESAAPLL